MSHFFHQYLFRFYGFKYPYLKWQIYMENLEIFSVGEGALSDQAYLPSRNHLAAWDKSTGQAISSPVYSTDHRNSSIVGVEHPATKNSRTHSASNLVKSASKRSLKDGHSVLNPPSLFRQAAISQTNHSAADVKTKAADRLTGLASGTPLTGDLSAETIKFNFQPNKAVVPTGYIKDFGQAYSDTRGYGWVTQASLNSTNPAPLNLTRNTRDRNKKGVEQRLDTLIHMQYSADSSNSNAVKTPAAWEYALPNGQYSVTVSVGDQGPYDSRNTINVEGVNAISSFRGSRTQQYKQATVVANVTDGKLTVDAIGGTNTKLNYIEIQPVQPPQSTVVVPVVEDESVYLKASNPNYNLNGSSIRGGLFSGVDGGLTPSPARFYLKFQLPTYVPGTKITSATLTGYYNDDYNPTDDGTHGIYFVADDSWSESTITWNNQPGQAYGLSEAGFDAAKADVGTFVSWDITNIVNQEYQGDGTLSLLFHANNEGVYPENQNWEYFAEKEFDSTKAFQIKLTTEP
jgi:hypothetical protein